MRSITATCWIFLAVFLFVRAGLADEPSANWPPTDPDGLLKQLKEKDAEFDNLMFEYEHREILHRNLAAEHAELAFLATKFGGKVIDAPPAFPKPFDLERISRVKYIIRGKETTMDCWSYSDGRGNWLDQPFKLKWSSVGGTIRNTTEMNGDKSVGSDGRPDDGLGLLHFKRFYAEFTLGVGYGRRLTQIDTITASGENILVEGTAKFFASDVTTARLEIDKDLIVRSGKLLVDVGGNGVRRYELSAINEGLSEFPNAPRVATCGQFMHIEFGERRKDNADPANFSHETFELKLLDIKSNLTDTEYQDLVKLDIPEKPRTNATKK